MKFVKNNFFVVLALSMFVFGCEKEASKDPFLAQYAAEAKAIYPSSEKMQNEWLLKNRESLMELSSLPYDKDTAYYKEIYALSLKLYPQDLKARKDFIIEKCIAAIAIEKLKGYDSISDNDFELIKRMSYNFDKDFSRCAEYAKELSNIIIGVNKLKGEVPAKIFEKNYLSMMESFEKNPILAGKTAMLKLEIEKNFFKSDEPEKFRGVKEYLDINVSNSDTKFENLKKAFRDEINFLPKEMFSHIPTFAEWHNVSGDFLKKIVQQSLYFYKSGGVEYPVYYIKIAEGALFLAPITALENGSVNIEIYNDKETLKCNLYKADRRTFCAFLVPEKSPNAVPIPANLSGSHSGDFRLVGINIFGHDVDISSSKSFTGNETLVFAQCESTRVFRYGALAFSSPDNLLCGVFIGGTVSVVLPDASFEYKELSGLKDNAKNSLIGLNEALEKCKLLPLEKVAYEEAFYSFAKLQNNAVIKSSSEVLLLAELKKFALQNKVLIRAFLSNKFSDMLSPEMKSVAPEIYSVVKKYEPYISGSNRITWNRFCIAYKNYLTELSNAINSTNPKLNTFNSLQNGIMGLAVSREFEIRNALMKTLDNILHYKGGMVPEILPVDLRNNVNGKYYGSNAQQ